MASYEWKVHKADSAISEIRAYMPGEYDYYWMMASVKWDGCVDLYMAGNVPFDSKYGEPYSNRDEAACDSYIHICNIPETIKDLSALWDLQRELFPQLQSKGGK